jgi:ADP-ribose pyrophosphatase YjhB (NUDIX family)
VVDQGKLLLVQQTSGRWTIPGGYVDSGEDGAAAAVRETWEEAHVRVRAEGPACAVEGKGFVAYRCALDGEPDPRGDALETRKAKFLTRDQVARLLPTELRFPEEQAAYLRFLDEPQ